MERSTGKPSENKMEQIGSAMGLRECAAGGLGVRGGGGRGKGRDGGEFHREK